MAERTAQQDPAAAAAMVRELTEAQQRAAALKERSARWQQTLNDGVADLNADIDYDLRDRMKEISRLAEDELMGGGDPGKVWDQFAVWVQQEVGDGGVGELHLGDTAGARAGPARRGPLLRRPGPGAARRCATTRRTRSGRCARWSRPTADEKGWAAKALIGLRGGYSSMAMFGMLGTVLGFASAVNPIGIGAAVFMSGKAIGDERKKQIARRQNEAKAAMRRYIDDVTFQVAQGLPGPVACRAARPARPLHRAGRPAQAHACWSRSRPPSAR